MNYRHNLRTSVGLLNAMMAGALNEVRLYTGKERITKKQVHYEVYCT